MKFKITDNQSGKTLVISGDAPPTEQEAEQLFQQSGIREQQPTQVPNMVLDQPKSNPLESLGNTMGPVSNMLMPNVVKYAQNSLQQIGAGNLTPNKPMGEDALMAMLGPGMQQVASLTGIGSELERQKNAGARELAQTVQGVRGIAGGINAAVGKTGEVVSNIVGAKSVNPWKVAGYAKDKAIAAAQPLTPEKGVQIGERIMDAANKAPHAFREDALRIAEGYANDFKNGRSIADTFTAKKNAQAVGYVARSGAKVRGAEAWMERETANILNKILKIEAPKAKAADALFSTLYAIPKTAQQLTWLMAKLGLAKGALGGL